MPPPVEAIDHVHVFVSDRAAAEIWYRDVLGLRPQATLAFWARDGGPLTLANEAGTVHLALFQQPRQACRSTVALAVGAAEFVAWQQHLQHVLGQVLTPEDHAVSWSLYLADPDGNPYEITTYAHAQVAQLLAG